MQLYENEGLILLDKYKFNYRCVNLQSIIYHCYAGDVAEPNTSKTPDEKMEQADNDISNAIEDMQKKIASGYYLMPEHSNDIRELSDMFSELLVNFQKAVFEMGFYAGYTVSEQLQSIPKLMLQAWEPTSK